VGRALEVSVAAIYGTSASETLIGSSADDTIWGFGGNDTLYGAEGNDTFYWSSGDGRDVVDGGVGNDTEWVTTLSGFSHFVSPDNSDATIANVGQGSGSRGDPFEDYVSTTAVENLTVVMKHSGTLVIGDLHTTAMTGTITLNATTADDRVVLQMAKDTYSNQLIGLGSPHGDTLSGGAANDIFYGYDGDDTLLGHGGTNEMVGGKGNDTYYAHAGDSLLELPGEGTDTIFMDSNYFVLNPNFEKLFFNGDGDFTGIGNDQDNWIQGNSGNDYLIGLGGDDTLYGAGGLNTLQGGAGNDLYLVETNDTLVEFAGEGTDEVQTTLPALTLPDNFENLVHTGSSDFRGTGNAEDNMITGAGGIDYLYGLDGADRLDGGAGNDVLDAGNGDDVLIGGAGGDEMGGGAGADRFVTSVFGDGVDLIHDFTRGDGDKIDIRAFTSAIGMPGGDPFASGILTFQSIADFFGAGPATYVMYDPDGSSGPQGSLVYLRVLGATPLESSDFIV
jgi:Ca2+-binding RTX toxin-like protein